MSSNHSSSRLPPKIAIPRATPSKPLLSSQHATGLELEEENYHSDLFRLSSSPTLFANNPNRISNFSLSSFSSSSTGRNSSSSDILTLGKKKLRPKASDRWQTLILEKNISPLELGMSDSRGLDLDGSILEYAQSAGNGAEEVLVPEEKVKKMEKGTRGREGRADQDGTIKSVTRSKSSKSRSRSTKRPSVLDFNFSLCPSLSLLSPPATSNPEVCFVPSKLPALSSFTLSSIPIPESKSSRPPPPRWESNSTPPNSPPKLPSRLAGSPILPSHSRSIWHHIRKKKNSTSMDSNHSSQTSSPPFNHKPPLHPLPPRPVEPQFSLSQALESIESESSFPSPHLSTTPNRAESIQSIEYSLNNRLGGRIRSFSTLQSFLLSSPTPSRTISVGSRDSIALSPPPRSKSKNKRTLLRNSNDSNDSGVTNSRRAPENVRLSWLESTVRSWK